MKWSKARIWIRLLCVVALVLGLALPYQMAGFLLMAAALLAAVAVLYRHLGELTDLPDGHPKLNTLRLVTVFSVVMLIGCTVIIVLTETGRIVLSEQAERTLAACIVCIVMLFGGNVAPKLPRSSHTGLRLPWTVADDETWIVAHRILGYLSLPLVRGYLRGIPVMKSFEVLTVTIFLLWIGIPAVLSGLLYYRKFYHKRS